MKQVSVVISTYTSDVSGVCSALYELGGMVVIHDPSGCNSTYNTHDEPRWFDQDSLIFISGLSQMDAIMGDDEKLIRDVVRAAEEFHPRFIALVRSPVPLMIGTDFDGIAREIETLCGIPTFFVPTTGMRSYVKGAGMALETMVRRFMPDHIKSETTLPEYSNIRVNVLGATPLDFSINGMYDSLKEYLLQEDFEIQGSLAMDTDYEQMLSLPEADVNLVVTASGLLAAKAMKERFQIPYVIGFPTACMKDKIAQAIRKVYQKKEEINLLEEQKKETGDHEKVRRGYLIHEPVIAASLAYALSEKYGVVIEALTMLDIPEDLVAANLCYIGSEEEMKERLSDADFVIADPMFQPICPKEISFYRLPHEAFSGRCYRKEIGNLLEI